MLRCAQHDNRGMDDTGFAQDDIGEVFTNLHSSNTARKSFGFVMLSAAKHLGTQRVRCFALLSMTMGEITRGSDTRDNRGL